MTESTLDTKVISLDAWKAKKFPPSNTIFSPNSDGRVDLQYEDIDFDEDDGNSFNFLLPPDVSLDDVKQLLTVLASPVYNDTHYISFVGAPEIEANELMKMLASFYLHYGTGDLPPAFHLITTIFIASLQKMQGMKSEDVDLLNHLEDTLIV